jgi:hypothetical protein
MRLQFAIIFLTGAATLALELLASRIMTPYFGVSLYIWAGILSITLVALACGYWWGGRLATRLAGARHGDNLPMAFLLMPAVGALSLVIACLAYPHVFPLLARMDLVLGAFAACLLLLAVPLVVTSAMNPLLIAMHARGSAAAGKAADSGAGRVFFASTVGSVAGVVVTAFYLIPTFSNFVSLLIVALMLAVLPLAGLRPAPSAPARRKPLAIVTAVALLASGTMLWQADAYLGRMWPVKYSGLEWTIEDSVGSMFGTVKVLRSSQVDAGGRFVRIYFQDGLIQNRMFSDGQPYTFYTFALEALAISYRPGMRTDAGAAYVFEQVGSTWVQRIKLTAPDAQAGDLFGHDVAIDGNAIVVGALGDDVAGQSGSGSAYVFVRNVGGTWELRRKLVQGHTSKGNDQYGQSVGLCGDKVVVGAPNSVNATSTDVDSGAAFTYSISDLIGATSCQ